MSSRFLTKPRMTPSVLMVLDCEGGYSSSFAVIVAGVVHNMFGEGQASWCRDGCWAVPK